jgi:hypothetical protein
LRVELLPGVVTLLLVGVEKHLLGTTLRLEAHNVTEPDFRMLIACLARGLVVLVGAERA